MKQPRRYYWDSSVFITALANDTKFGEDTLIAASEILRLVSIGEAVIVSSTILVTEVLPSYCTTEQYDQFQATLQSPFLVLRGVDMAVARKAAELRDSCIKHEKKLRLATPDAIHIATYLLYQKDIDQIHSYDPHFPKKFSWLRLAGSPVYPYMDQMAMMFSSENIMEDPDKPTAELDNDESEDATNNQVIEAQASNGTPNEILGNGSDTMS